MQVRMIIVALALAAGTTLGEEPRPIVSFGRTGFILQLPDGSARLHVHGYRQADGRAFCADDKHALSDTAPLRRLRPTVDGSFFGWREVRIMPESCSNKSGLEAAYLGGHPFAWL